MRKKVVAFNSNSPALYSGFGGFMRELLTYLYKTGKYDLVMYAAGLPWQHPSFEKWPWRTYGTIPTTPAEVQLLNSNPELARGASYGQFLIDRFLKEVKPDAIVFSEDIWSHDCYRDKPWWGKIPCISHTTLDSLPILPTAIETAKKTPYFFCWADFATKELNRLGLAHVKTLHGSVDTKTYKRLPRNVREELRIRHKIPLNAFVTGMVFRNQLRKQVSVLLEGFKLFKLNNPNVPAKLITVTHYSEGWNIPRMIEEYGLDKEDILCVYKCRATHQYYVLPFKGQEIDNPENGAQKALVTVNVTDGVSNEQLNEIYNLMDVYCHPITSGGLERPIYEAKLTELITLVTNYSCGEDCCVDGAYSLELDYTPTREIGTDFIKAATKPESLYKQLTKVFNMPLKTREEWGSKARKWVLENYSIEVIGKKFEELLDSLPITDYDFEFEKSNANPDVFVDNLPDNKEWVKQLYNKILGREPDQGGFEYWLKSLEGNMPRANIEGYFREVARNEVKQVNKTDSLQDILGNEKPAERLLINIPESLGDCMYVTCLLKDARELYADKKIYVATKEAFMDVFRPLVGKYIDYVLPWQPAFDNGLALEGGQGAEKQFEIVLQTHTLAQRSLSYQHNAVDKSKIDFTYAPSR